MREGEGREGRGGKGREGSVAEHRRDTGGYLLNRGQINRFTDAFSLQIGADEEGSG